MPITLSALRTIVRRDLRDSGATPTWSTDELNDMIKWGTQEVSRVRPQETYETASYTAPAVGAFFTIDTLTLDSVYRVDAYNSGGKLLLTVPFSQVTEANGGWDFIDGKLHMPQYFVLPNNCTLRVFGYKHYTQPTSDSSTIELDDDATNAVRAWVAKEAMFMLISDRVRFQQWAVASGASDTNSIQLAQLYSAAQRRWEQMSKAIRRVRKTP
jgi:hypothetical protein